MGFLCWLSIDEYLKVCFTIVTMAISCILQNVLSWNTIKESDLIVYWFLVTDYVFELWNLSTFILAVILDSFKIISIHAEWYLYCHNRNFCISFHCWYMRWKLEYTHTELNLWLIMLYKSHPKIINLHMWHYWFMYDIIIFPQFFFVLVYPNCPALCKSFTHLHLR